MTPPRWYYSFRSSDFTGRSERKGKHAPQVPAAAEEGQHECRRDPAHACAGWRLEQHGDGTFTRHPGLTYRPFCEPCEAVIVAALGDIPDTYARLAEAVGDRPVSGTGGHGAFGPRMEYRADVDALMGDITATLGMWAARVRPVARLSAPQHANGTPERAGEDAEVLAAHIGVLMALQPQRRHRTYPLRPTRRGPGEIPAELMDVVAGDELVRQGVDYVTVLTDRDSDGAAAGNEILALYHRARRVLGETRPPREVIDGVPCRECESMSLERAEPPSDPSLAAARSRCASCGDVMDEEEFAAWARRYAAWAEGAGLAACAKCRRGDHGACRWAGCGCKTSGHRAA